MAKTDKAVVRSKPSTRLGRTNVPDSRRATKHYIYLVYTRKEKTSPYARLWSSLSEQACKVRSAKQLLSCFRDAPPASTWLSLDPDDLLPLGDQFAATNTEHKLVLFSHIEESTRYFLNAYFRHVLTARDALTFLEPPELVDALAAPNREDLFIAGTVDDKERAVVLYRGTIDPVVVPLAWFVNNASDKRPDPTRFGLCDYGQTVRLGAFEASAEAILYEFDPAFRRRRRKTLIDTDASFGGSVRRLRLQKGLNRSDFPGIDAKTVARIERNEIEQPHERTLDILALVLDVPKKQLGSY
jgi:hypothetical protein